MIYTYANAAGERREIVASMKEPPPEVVEFFPDGSWKDAKAGEFNGQPVYGHVSIGSAMPLFHRVYEAPPVHVHGNRGAVDYKNGKPPVSRFLPLKAGGVPEQWGNMTVRNHGGGIYTDSMGRRIVRNESDAKRHEADTGLVRVKPD